jgi:Porin PorA
MRRVIGLTLAGLGAFLVVVAVLLRSYVGGQLIKFPKNEYFTTTLLGSGVSYFSPSMVRSVSGATMRVTSTVKGDAAAGTSSAAVWNVFTYLYDTTNHATFQFTTRRLAFDRRSAQLVNCCGANIGGNTAIRQSGLVGFLWPFGTQKTTYDVFDPNLNKPRPAQFEGTSTLDGIPVYRFVEHVPSMRSGSQQIPGSLVGMKTQPLVTLPEYYTGTNTFWVDPVTGAQLDVRQDDKLTLGDATGAQRLVLFDGALTMTPQSVRAVVNLDATGRSEFEWFEVIVPLVCGLAGIAALITGIVLARTRREDDQDHAAAAAPEPVLDPAT